jgi:hypothetical protein
MLLRLTQTPRRLLDVFGAWRLLFRENWMSYSDILKPRREVLSEEGIEGIIDLANVDDRRRRKLEARPADLFDLTYPTADTRRVVQTIHRRFSGDRGAPGLFLFEGLKGSGKSHLLVLVYHLFVKDNAGVLKAVADLKNLKVEDRYLWRVASALKWAFADFDSASVGADMATIETDDDRKRLSELFAMRPTCPRQRRHLAAVNRLCGARS